MQLLICILVHALNFYTFVFLYKSDDFDDWLTVHRSITLFDLQLDAQILIYLHILHLLKSSTCFEHYPAHLQDVYVVIVYMQPLVSVTFCR